MLLSDNRERFDSGDEAIDQFFQRYAGQNQYRHHVSVTYVAVEDFEIRLGVDRRAQGKGIGRALVRHTCQLASMMCTRLGCVGIVVDAKLQSADFYLALGFTYLPLVALDGPQAALFLPISAILKAG